MVLSIFLFSAILLFSGCQPDTVAKQVTVSGVHFVPQRLPLQGATVGAGDLNHDGYPDLVGASETSLNILLGDGQGKLTHMSSVPGGEQPVDFALADLDADGDMDIAVANHETDYLTLLLGDGTGSFEPAPNSPLRITVRPHPHAVAAADLDADGHVDLLVDHREAASVLMLRGLGDGRFVTPGSVVKVGGDPYRGMAVGDMNHDGRPDLVTPNPGEVGILLNTTRNELSFTQVPPVAADAPFAVDLGDFNGDGKLDLLAASDEGSSLIELYYGGGDGGFQKAGDSPITFQPGGKKITTGDLNGDGITDAAVSSYLATDVLLIFGGARSLQTGHLPAGEHPWGLAAADYNGDGIDDLVIGNDGNQQATVYLSRVR